MDPYCAQASQGSGGNYCASSLWASTIYIYRGGPPGLCHPSNPPGPGAPDVLNRLQPFDSLQLGDGLAFGADQLPFVGALGQKRAVDQLSPE